MLNKFNNYRRFHVKDSQVVEAYDVLRKGFAGTVDTTISFDGHSEVYLQGKEDGNDFSISDKIVGQVDKEISK